MDFNKHSIRLVQNCPVCNRQYQENKVQILDEAGNSFLAYMTCSFCWSNIIVRVISLPQGLVGSAILTDLFPDEVIKFGQSSSLQLDDILNVHSKLYDNSLITYLKNN
ncbi:MAG: hypothetical protein COX77_00060 [Candidatus Komeilibacteria bacterium CG_4_10_14_0_2_um_filter_37_10]|uniref:Uncharacterized protein n=1 Tax=Candidatus Komeilibacteria bacterium CG_4_10_14_0_2_um_filter_37_10 TaxID=1974470 RepID=A0A2M7VGR8_9BACT|nr:MAG: hypothetical protein COX77_00060 [Candidatus Komeilibacteria bacterium CG_4_10_14_0_2_um_filter_37_10]PJA93472.1 MAG: hypothetical protein CO133_01205 [Candidatus Komeilibacteria bacterium CG_4_9_14_3_um_filter_37_5]